jgi:hypothetical protein
VNPNKYEDYPIEKKKCGAAYLHLEDVESNIEKCKKKLDELSE